MRPSKSLVCAAAVLAFLAGCATVSPDGGVADVQKLTQGRTAGVEVALGGAPTAQIVQAVSGLLAQPVDEAAAVRIALLNNPGLHASMATLGISDADRVQAGRLPNPHLALGRFIEGDKLEIERILTFNVIGLLTLPWRSQWAGQQTELAKLQAAQEVVRMAADTRKAWINAVAAQQTARYMRDVKEAAEAGAELARRLAKVGNWSRLNQAREQSFLVDATAQLARSEQAAFASREQLTRMMGLWGAQTSYQLPDRLPDLPKAAREITDVEAQAIAQRLDVRSATMEASYVANSLGFVKASGLIDALDVSYTHTTTFDNAAGSRETKRGFEIELPLPIFDWGQARNARARSVYMQSVSKVREVGVRARSEAREAYHGYRTAFDLARFYRDEVVPLRKFISDEVLLRYSGMITSIFELLSDARTNVMAVNASIEAQRDFWLADADLQTTLTGTSPGGLSRMQATTPTGGEAQGH
jgi:multidrug efflux system outer membrane protein